MARTGSCATRCTPAAPSSLGAALAVDPPVASATWALPLVALVRRIGIEEEMLRGALGSDYEAFARGRARLVPGVW